MRLVREFDDLPQEEKTDPDVITDYCQMFSKAGYSDADQRWISRPDEEDNQEEESPETTETPTFINL